jgi:peptide/nickel transport system substrate-binding protein
MLSSRDKGSKRNPSLIMASRFIRRKLVASVIAGAAVATVVLAAAATPSGGTTAGREGGTLRIAYGEFLDYIDPAISAYAWQLLDITCAKLMNYPDKPLPAGRRIVPEVAADYPKISANGRTYTFTIRDDYRFSTGARVTARSFAHAIDRLLSPKMQSPFASILDDVLGAGDVTEGRAASPSGVQVRGNRLVIKLTKKVPDLPARLTLPAFCAVPATLPIDPEGVAAPLPGAGPYYIAEYIPQRQVVIRRNRFYRGSRPHHIDQFVVEIGDDPDAVLAKIERGEADWGDVPPSSWEELGRKYGVNKSRFFVQPTNGVRLLALNTGRPLFRNNLALRQAVNFAVDRKALLRERGRYAGYLTDQYLSPGMPGYRNARIYPIKRPDLKRAKVLAQGHTRSGRAVLYIRDRGADVAQAQIIKANLKQIGIDVEIKQFPVATLFDPLSGIVRNRGEPFDMTLFSWATDYWDPYDTINVLLDGRTIREHGNSNISYFNSPKYNELMERASRLSGPARYRAYGRLDVDLARNAAPMVAYAFDSSVTFVSRRVACVTATPGDLIAVCLK